MPTPVVYDNFMLRQHNGSPIDLDTNTVKIMLVTASYTPSATTHATTGNLTNQVAASTGYTAGGSTVANKAIALDAGNVEWSHDDVTFGQNATGFTNARYAVWYGSTGSGLIMYMDLGGNKSVTGGDLTLDASAASGVLQIT